ncbi:hypothetical protein QVD17_04274 [Tagetes erecta]|uniref:Uncharacterized protein n=1 Tax=Tagetes erecta TaxID=13708 RepID=A0AAD8P466_TARER|nr:hypothetical protein QVD17_04274 [Tagetes erecta]
MDYRLAFEDVSLEKVRESLVAISYCEPERFSCVTKHQVLSNENCNIIVASANITVETAIDELRSKLLRIASSVPSIDYCNGYGEV